MAISLTLCLCLAASASAELRILQETNDASSDWYKPLLIGTLVCFVQCLYMRRTTKLNTSDEG